MQKLTTQNGGGGVKKWKSKPLIFDGPLHFGLLVFAFLPFWGSIEYVNEIWLSLVERARIFIFEHPPFWVVIFNFFLIKSVKNYFVYTFASNGIYRRVYSLGAICNQWADFSVFFDIVGVEHP